MSTESSMKFSREHGEIFEEKITLNRRKTNPYIGKVEQDADIWIQEEKIFHQAGKWNEYFQNKNEIILEIGTGLGNFFSEEVAQNTEKNFIGVEIKYKRLFVTAEKTRKKLYLKGNNNKINNFILLKTKGENIKKFLADKEISKTYIFFPDPWGRKERQKKHRLLQEDFIKNLYTKTKPGGGMIFKTDHREYFDSTLQVLNKINLWKITLVSYDYQQDNINYQKSKITEFETIFHTKNICYLVLEKT